MVMEITLFSTTSGEYGIQLTNNQLLVVNLSRRTCSHQWWQLRGLSYVHAIIVIENQKLWVYDYVSNYYKATMQRIVYLNVVHLMETHDSAHVDDRTGLVIGGKELDDGYN